MQKRLPAIATLASLTTEVQEYGMFQWCWRYLGAFLVIGAALAMPAFAQTKLALVIGNAAYGALPVLSNPANDAKLIAANLEKVGFRVTLLTDQTQGQIKAAISTFADDIEESGSDTIAAFYYAGHGVQIEGANYLIPVDAALKTKSDVVLHAVSVSDLLKTLEFARARVNLLVLDACRDNPFATGTRSITRGLARIDAPAGSIVAYATAPGQVAQDGENGNSPYATALAENIATPGLSLEDVFRKVRISVSEKTGGQQMPWEETSLTQEVMLAGNAAAPAPIVEAPAPAPTAAPDVQSAHAYQLAVASNTVEAYSSFIGKFPTAKETPLAMRNIEMLNDEANWSKAVTLNTVGSYRNYMTLHPDGVYFNEAQERMAALVAKPNPTPKSEPPEIVVQPTPPPRITLIQQDGYDVFGDDLQPIRDVSFAAWQSACAAMGQCVAVSYRVDLNRCYPKSTATLAVRNGKVRYAIKQEAVDRLKVSGFEFVPQADVVGTEYGDAKARDPQTCLEMCERDSNCAAFSYAVNNKTCYFKSSVVNIVENRKVVSGLRRD